MTKPKRPQRIPLETALANAKKVERRHDKKIEAAFAEKMDKAAGDPQKIKAVMKEWIDEGLHRPAPVGPIIKEARRNKGMTQKELADIAGVTPATIQKYETGVVKNVPWLPLILIQQALEIPPEKFGFAMGTMPKNEAELMVTLSRSVVEFFDTHKTTDWFFTMGDILIADLSRFDEKDVVNITTALIQASSNKRRANK